MEITITVSKTPIPKPHKKPLSNVLNSRMKVSLIKSLIIVNLIIISFEARSATIYKKAGCYGLNVLESAPSRNLGFSNEVLRLTGSLNFKCNSNSSPNRYGKSGQSTHGHSFTLLALNPEQSKHFSFIALNIFE